MSKGMNRKKEAKKKPAKSLQEKRAAKRRRNRAGISGLRCRGPGSLRVRRTLSHCLQNVNLVTRRRPKDAPGSHVLRELSPNGSHASDSQAAAGITRPACGVRHIPGSGL